MLTAIIIISYHHFLDGRMLFFYGASIATFVATAYLMQKLVGSFSSRFVFYLVSVLVFGCIFALLVWFVIPLGGFWSFAAMLTLFLPPCLEEIGKSLYTRACSRKTTSLLIGALFVALGFSVVENILYLWGQWDTATYIGRNILSTPLHILASLLIARNLLVHDSFLGYIYALAIGVSFHLVFNLTLGFSIIPVIILAIGYLFATKPLPKISL